MTTRPIACTLTAEALRERRASLIPGLVARARAIEATDNGYDLCFDPAPDVVTAIAQVIDAERHCCQFLQFEVRVDADHGDVRLSITGPDGTRSFLDDMMAPIPP